MEKKVNHYITIRTTLRYHFAALFTNQVNLKQSVLKISCKPHFKQALVIAGCFNEGYATSDD